jgi:hypothetical protein
VSECMYVCVVVDSVELHNCEHDSEYDHRYCRGVSVGVCECGCASECMYVCV